MNKVICFCRTEVAPPSIFKRQNMRRIYLQKAKTEVARSNTIRNINRQIVLNYVREREPISRAEIAKQTNLQRSTISSIVSSLVIENFIEEVGAGASSGGRKPTMLRLRRDEIAAVGVDITPTLTTIATANLGGKILDTKSFETSPDADETFAKLAVHLTQIKAKLKSQTVEIGISVPGMVDSSTGIVTYVPYFNWKNWQLKQQIEKQFDLPVRIDNDANAIALAESWFGRPQVRGVKNFVSVLVVDGIGTGIIFDGQIYRGNKGAAGEFGHMVIGTEDENAGGVLCSCGSAQCWESFASNTATTHRFNSRSKQNPKEIDEILARARDGDELARAVALETTRYLGRGIVNLIVGLSPEAVIISGKIVGIWGLIEDELQATISANIRQQLPPTVIIASTLGEHPTLMGAISLSLIHKFASAT